ncbi:kinetochore scaffold 1 [Pelobates fuscus]|uniref:kinetochore scaffold 1 n=1 Tax=Pelobates fuscus TaxID=191477 RepID=UPI002FE4EB3D
MTSQQRHISSILKMSRSHLKDLGSGNELYQDSEIDKRQKSLRRVSFAKTIRVFTPEQQAVGGVSLDDNHGDGGAAENEECGNEEQTSTVCNISGMDRLLKAPIQTSLRLSECNDEWAIKPLSSPLNADTAPLKVKFDDFLASLKSNGDGLRDRTMVFSCENDMDMTASNTVFIDQLDKENHQNMVQTSQNRGLCKKTEFKFSTSQKTSTSQSQMDSFLPKVKCDDFMASLKSHGGGLRDRTMVFSCENDMDMTASNTVFIDQLDKENHQNIPETTLLASLKSQSGDLCKTVDFKSFQKPSTSQSQVNALLPKETFDDFMASLKNNGTRDRTMVFSCENDMDMTASNTVFIDQLDKENHPTMVQTSQNRGLCKKTELTFSTSPQKPSTSQSQMDSFLPKVKCDDFMASLKSHRGGLRDRTMVFSCENDMDMTASNTVFIDQLNKENQQNIPETTLLASLKSQSGDLCKNADFKSFQKPSTSQSLPKVKCDDFGASLKSHGGGLRDRTMVFSCENDMDMTASNTVFIDQLDKENHQNIPETTLLASFKSQSGDLCKNTDFKSFQKPSTSQSLPKVKCDDFGASLKSHGGGLRDRTMVFSCENDMDMTASNTVFIDQLDKENHQNIPETTLLASLKSQSGDLCKNTDFKSLTSSQKPSTSQSNTGSLQWPKIKFDFKTSSTTELTTKCLGNNEKIFPDNLPSSSAVNPPSDCRMMPPFARTYEMTGNVTQIFREHEGLDLTQCHTTSITSFIPLSANPPVPEDLLYKSSRSKLKDKTKLFEEDMDMTRSNTVNIEDIQHDAHPFVKIRKSTGVGSLAPDRTIIFKDSKEMDFTGINTDLDKCSTLLVDGKVTDIPEPGTNHEMHANLDMPHTLPDRTVLFSCDHDMDFTKSHTVSIDSKNSQEPAIPDKPKNIRNNKRSDNSRGGLRLSSLVNIETLFSMSNDLDNPVNNGNGVGALNMPSVHNKTQHLQDDMEITDTGRNDIHEDILFPVKVITNTSFKEKTVFFSPDQKDMDISRSHTVAIDHQIRSEIQVTDGKECRSILTHRKVVSPSKFKSHIFATDIKDYGRELCTSPVRGTPCNREICIALPNEEGMDFTKSHTVYIERPVTENLDNKCLPVSKTKEISLNNTLRDKTILFPSGENDMDITQLRTANIETKLLYTNVSTAKIPQKSVGAGLQSVLPEKTLVCEDEMELTKSHTMIIDLKDPSKSRGQNLSVGESPLCAADSQQKQDVTMSTAVLLSEGTTSGSFKSGVPVKHSISSRKTDNLVGDEHMIGSNSALIMSHVENRSIERRHTVCNPSQDKTLMFSCDPDHMEITRSHTVAIERVSSEVPKIQSPDIKDVNDFTEVTQNDYNVTLCVTQASDSNFVKTKDLTMEVDMTNHGNVFANFKGILPATHGDHSEKVDVHGFTTGKASSEGVLPLNPCDKAENDPQVFTNLSMKHVEICDNSNSSFDNPQEAKTDNVACVVFHNECDGTSVEDEAAIPNKNVMTVNDQAAKKEKLKSKRVSFVLPQSKIEMSDVITAPPNCSPVLPQIPFTSEIGSPERERESKTETLSPGYGPVSGSTASQLVCFKPVENAILRDWDGSLNRASNNLHSVPKVSDRVDPGNVEILKSNPIRRSINDIHLKIKSLTRKSRSTSTGHIVHASPPADQELQPGEAATIERDEHCEVEETLPKDRFLPNRLSVKIVQPKLPHKRSSGVDKIPETRSSSESRGKRDRTSLIRLKALTDIDDSTYIDKEMLPAYPGDPNDDVLGFEVPEGAWESLCEKEPHRDTDSCLSEPGETKTCRKRARKTEEVADNASVKRVRQNDDTACTTVPKTLASVEPTYSASYVDSRIELSSQQFSQMDSPSQWDAECDKSLWQKFQDGSITVKEFFTLLRIPILIQKPRYSELPANSRPSEGQNPLDVLLDHHIYQHRLQVYEEECNRLYQTIEELKVCAETQEKPLIAVNSLLWEAMRMCSEEEVLYFGVQLKSLKASYAKKSKCIGHKDKVEMYSKLLNTAEGEKQQLQSIISDADELIEEVEKMISDLERETAELRSQCESGRFICKDPKVQELEIEIENLKVEEENRDRACSQMEDQKEQLLMKIASLQEESKVLKKRIEDENFAEWDLNEWTDEKAFFSFLYDSLELHITFGDLIDGVNFVNKSCRHISDITFYSLLDDDAAPPSTCLVHRLVTQFIRRKQCSPEHYKTQQDLPRLLFDISLVVSRCKLLGEEVEYLTKWGPRYCVMKTAINGTDIKLMFSSVAAMVKFDVIIKLSDSYPISPLMFTFQNHIGNMECSLISTVLSKVPVGAWYLKRTVIELYNSLLTSPIPQSKEKI